MLHWLRALNLKRFTQHPALPTRLQAASNLLVLLTWWGVFFSQLYFEWNNNPQYAYGWCVPWVAAFLFYLRLRELPAAALPKAPGHTLTLAGLAGLLLCFCCLYLIFETHIDWRLVIWLQAAVAVGATWLLAQYWTCHPKPQHWLAGVVAVCCLGVPWPTVMEMWTIHTLLKGVIHVTVSTLNTLGIAAIQQGNLIVLSKHFVSMEEACSGVRSLQSSLMLSVFLGELWRLSLGRRAILVGVGLACALGFNVLRAIGLSLSVYRFGPAATNHWHGPASEVVFLACLLSISAAAWWLKSPEPSPAPHAARPDLGHWTALRWLPTLPCLGLVAGLLALPPIAHYWYASGPSLPHAGISWHVDWQAGCPQSIQHDIPAHVQETLVFDVGSCVSWQSPGEYSWLAYYFQWQRDKAAQLGGFHGPELCLPTAGWNLPEEGPQLQFSQGPVELIFRSFRFHKNQQSLYVFFTQWDRSGYPYHTQQGRLRLDRLRQVWQRKRSKLKTNLQVMLLGPQSFDHAADVLRTWLEQAIVVDTQLGQGQTPLQAAYPLPTLDS
jgi:exosortase